MRSWSEVQKRARVFWSAADRHNLACSRQNRRGNSFQVEFVMLFNFLQPLLRLLLLLLQLAGRLCRLIFQTATKMIALQLTEVVLWLQSWDIFLLSFSEVTLWNTVTSVEVVWRSLFSVAVSVVAAAALLLSTCWLPLWGEREKCATKDITTTTNTLALFVVWLWVWWPTAVWHWNSRAAAMTIGKLNAWNTLAQ